MKLSEAAKIAKLIQTSWPNPGEMPEQMAEVFHLGLGDLPYEAVSAALAELIRTKTFRPSAAEIRTATLTPLTGSIPVPELAWEEVMTQLRTLWPHQTPEFSHPLIDRAVRIMGWRQLCESEMPVADRKHFLDIYGQLREGAVRQVLVTPLDSGDELRPGVTPGTVYGTIGQPGMAPVIFADDNDDGETSGDHDPFL